MNPNKFDGAPQKIKIIRGLQIPFQLFHRQASIFRKEPTFMCGAFLMDPRILLYRLHTWGRSVPTPLSIGEKAKCGHICKNGHEFYKDGDIHIEVLRVRIHF